MALVLKTDTNPGTARWEEEAAGGGDEEVTVLSAASADLQAEPTRNIAYSGAGLNFDQPLPTPASGNRVLYRFLNASTGESAITLTYGVGAGVVGKETVDGPQDSCVAIYDSDTDGWYIFPGAVLAP